MEEQTYRTDVGVGGNREYKDTLFRKIFGSEENRRHLLSLYNALNNSSYDNPDDMEIMTMEDVLYVSIKNDIAFVFGSEVNLYEHQSTINYNMPIRGFLYTAKLLQNWIEKNDKNIYQKKQVQIPTPNYVVFYNGKEPLEDKTELRLSDAFMHPAKGGMYEWTAAVYNINYGRNREIMEKCVALQQYADFVRMVRENCQKYEDLKIAINEAMEVAIQKNYLDGYFKKEKEGVFMTTLFQVDREVYENDLREEGIAVGIEKGREEGRAEMRIEMQINIICILMEKQGITYEEACDLLDIPKEEWNLYREGVEEKEFLQQSFHRSGR